MKVSIDGKDVLTLSETQKKVIMHDIPSEIFEDDMRRRVCYILQHKYEQCYDRLKKEWEPKLAAAGAKSIPTNPDEFAEMVFASADYKNRSAREADDSKEISQ